MGGTPSSIAINPLTNKIYVELGGDNVAVIDGATNTFTTFNAGSVGAIAVNPVTDKIYISNGPFSGIISPLQVSEVDGATNEVTIIAPGSAGPLAVNPVTNKIYVSSPDGVTVIDGATRSTTTVAVASSGSIAVNPVTNKVYVSSGLFSNTASPPSDTVIDGSSNVTTFMAPSIAGSIVVDPVGNLICVTDTIGSDSIIYDGVTNVETIGFGGVDKAVAVNPVTNKIYGPDAADNLVVVLDVSTIRTTGVSVGPEPQVIVVDPVTNTVYALGIFDVTAIDGSTNATTLITVGGQPQDIAVNPVTGNVYVSNALSGTVTVIGPPAAPPIPPQARLTNISVRAQVGTGAGILIPGFAVSGSGTETVLIRADGPGLVQFNVPGALAQPSLSVFDGTGAMVASNTGWGANQDPAQISATAAQVGAFPFAPGSADCALVVSLPAGSYTAHISGVGNTTGVALAEVYEISSTGTRLVNLSTRAQVGSGANIVIPGFVISGGSEDLLVRADGPALAQYGVAGFLAQPSLKVFDASGTLAASNSGWASADIGLIAGFDAAVGAFALQPGSADSAQVVRLAPGGYTMPVSSLDGSSGVALAEVYEAQ